jgi:hypothetical protein
MRGSGNKLINSITKENLQLLKYSKNLYENEYFFIRLRAREYDKLVFVYTGINILHVNE